MRRFPMSGAGLILLAAGGSRRLGTPKQLLRDAEGVSLLCRAARTAAASECRPIVVVLGGAAEECAAELDGLPVQIVVNTDWQSGMASSVKAGLAALTAEYALDAVVIMLCDQPGVTPALLHLLIAARENTRHDIAACTYGEVVGVPALFGRALFGELGTLQGDEGARRVMKSYQGPMSRVSFPEGTWDIDTPGDAGRLIAADALPRARPHSQ